MANWNKWSTEDLKKAAELLEAFVEELEFEASAKDLVHVVARLTPEERAAYLKGTPEERNRLISSKMQ